MSHFAENLGWIYIEDQIHLKITGGDMNVYHNTRKGMGK